MKKFILGVSMLMLSSVLVSADEILQSIPTSNFPINDTIADCRSTMTPIADGKCFVNLYDNADGIFFQILVKDHRLQQKFLHDGLTVYIDPKAKKNTKQYVQFPTLTPPPMMPQDGHPHGQMKGDGQRETLKEGARKGFGPRNGEHHGRMNTQNDSTLFEDFRQDKRLRGPHDRMRHRERSRMLKMLVSHLGDEVTTFNVKKNSTILDANACKVFVSGNDVVFTAYVPYNLIGNVNKKNTISLGICEKEKEDKTSNNDFGMPGPPPPGGPGFGGPRPGGPMGMGGFAPQNSKQMLNSEEKFATWIVFQIKNSSFTED